MDDKTAAMVREWLAMHHGRREELAHWMTRTLRIGNLPTCRRLIELAERQATAVHKG